MSEEILLSTFERLRRQLLRISSGILRNDDDAQDALQDAFCRLWKNYRDVSTTNEMERLSLTIVKNQSISLLRQRRETLELNEQMDSDEAIDTSTNDAATAAERFQQVERLVATRLNKTQQEVLRRRDMEGQDFERIARDLGLTQEATRMHLSRARKQIRKLYNDTHP